MDTVDTALLLLGFLVAGYWAWRTRRRAASTDPPPDSIVLLLAEPLDLSPAVIAQRLSREFGVEFEVSEDEVELEVGEEESPDQPDPSAGSGSFRVAGAPPVFFVSLWYPIEAERQLIIIHCHPEPYVPDPAKDAASIGEMRRQRAMRDHRAWLSADSLMELGRLGADRTIGRVLAAITEGEVLGAYHPRSNRLAPAPGNLIELLRSPEPVRVLFDDNSLGPVLEVEDDDPRLVAAKQEAVGRFPEFAAAFSAKQGDQFAVKAPLTRSGVTEHIWIEVDSILFDQIQGRLLNEPNNLSGLRLNSSVEVPVTSLDDWLIFQGEQQRGGFFEKVFVEIAREKGQL